jgi:hypothetical protein
MQPTRNSFETARGPAERFSGDVFIDTVATPSHSSRTAAASVHFTPGARTACTHPPFGQTIFVTEGAGPSARASRSRRFAPAPASTSSPRRITGTAPPPTAS